MSEVAAKGQGNSKGVEKKQRFYRNFRRIIKTKIEATEINEGELQHECVEETSTSQAKPRVQKPAKICKFFNTEEGCRAGENCRFRHVVQTEEKAEKSVGPEAQPKPQNQRRGPVVPNKIILKTGQEGSEEQKAAFSAEIRYFKRRYRYCQITKNEGTTFINFKYFITEPDWVFDVKAIHFIYSMRESYPLYQPVVSIPEFKNRALPTILINHMERTISEALEAKYKFFAERNAFENSGKNFLHWIDRNISTMFVEGLRRQKLVVEAEAAGITLVTRKVQEVKISLEPASTSQLVEEQSESEEFDEESEEDIQEKEGFSKEASSEIPHEFPLHLSLVWKNESQNIASITPVSLPVLVSCVRCKEEKEHELPANGLREFRCPKCVIVQTVRTRGELVHENSSILAKFDCRGCRPVDLILLNAQLKFVCLNCNREDKVQKINYGLAHRSFCQKCYKLCEFVINVARFSGDFAKCDQLAIPSSALPKPAKQKIIPGPIITPGHPLPERGTCKHYKKSYRWFRFPCCGRAFPCDSCHEEANLGHEMKIANRMICGHCSFEQPFVAKKPCSKCHENVTRTKSRFWEGGKGCRDKIKMSRNDVHKYTDGKTKTVPKKKI